MQHPINSRIWKVGLTVLAGIVLFYLGIVWAQRSSLFAPEQKSYQVLFDNVNGLLIGDPVTVRGFVSGRVLDIVPDIEAVTVTISMDDRIELRRDARAEILIKELMGGKQVAIHPGLSEEVLPPGSSLPGLASLDFSSSFSEFGAVIEEVNVDQVNHLLARLDTFAGSLNDMANAMPAEKLQTMVNRFERMSIQMEEGLQEVQEGDWLNKLDKMLLRAEKTLGRTDSALGNILTLSEGWEKEDMESIQAILSQAESSITEVNQMIGRVDQILDTLVSEESLAGQILTQKSFRIRIDSTITKLDRALEQIYEKRVIVGLKRKKTD